ncbi:MULTISPECIES: hypothetical protein [unclassified Mesorhizobium]|uniref:hypothetical protein n=1 Tax=unclassified Mesorhizobium TaxID=325217 RepID=UPI001FDA832C|nr:MULTISPECIES: hypothetical protein [unclassified Mesorhizobium]
MEIGQAGLVDGDRLAVDDEVFRIDRLCLAGKLDIAARPVVAVLGNQQNPVVP